jgi:hypothetical protein
MIRFLPDNWMDVVMRPLDMISPEGNIYVETQAPDLRLAAAVLLGVAVLLTSARSRPDRGPALRLLGVTLLAMVPWLVTTGNGRYFTAFLLLLGPLCVGLARLLPLSRLLKFSAIGMLLLLQGFLIAEASPWGSWALAYWGDGPYFQVATPPAQPRSYVTITPISYSLIAPQFPAQSRWMNLSGPFSGENERESARRWLAEARFLTVIVPSLPSQMREGKQPSAGVIKVFNNLMRPRIPGLSVAADVHCEFLPSGGLARMALRQGAPNDPAILADYGFWLCPAHYDAAAPASAPQDAPNPDRELDGVFEVVEKLCPRFFPPGEAITQRVEGAAMRSYVSDTRVYVMDDGEVLYKFWRSINPVTIGRKAEVLAGRIALDCSKIRAPNWRSGGP